VTERLGLPPAFAGGGCELDAAVFFFRLYFLPMVFAIPTCTHVQETNFKKFAKVQHQTSRL
jgi:hypothetical protein